MLFSVFHVCLQEKLQKKSVNEFYYKDVIRFFKHQSIYGLISTIDDFTLEAPTEGEGATCKSCGRCPWMNLNTINKVLNVFKSKSNEIILSHDIIAKAKTPIDRMVNFRSNKNLAKRV